MGKEEQAFEEFHREYYQLSVRSARCLALRRKLGARARAAHSCEHRSLSRPPPLARVLRSRRTLRRRQPRWSGGQTRGTRRSRPRLRT
jgi:hypothetical protein